MAETLPLDRLPNVAARKRWLIGLSFHQRGRCLSATLVGSEGHGLGVRAEVFARHAKAVPRRLVRSLARLRGGRCRPSLAANVAAGLAEVEAMLLDEFSGTIAPVWNRILAVSVEDFGIWRQSAGLRCQLSLCDAGRLAELSGMNVIDGFGQRDLALEGNGRPLTPVPYWILLRDPQKTRVVVERQRGRLTYLPASRDVSGAAGVQCLQAVRAEHAGKAEQEFANFVGQAIRAEGSPWPDVDELVLVGSESWTAESLTGDTCWARMTHDVPRLPVAQLRIPAQALAGAAVAVLGQLLLDQVPANLPSVTGARAPRLLGRVTPGLHSSWQRLLHDLAAKRHNVFSLRSAV